MSTELTANAFFDRLSTVFSAETFVRIEAAWLLAVKAHTGQLRQSGEPYVTHPLAVAEILFDAYDADADAICAALLHDVVEDTSVTLPEIREQFGRDVALIVDGVSKLDAVRTATSPDINRNNTLRKLVLAGGQDRRVFAVKLADRLHNMRTLGAVSAEKRRRISWETYLVFCPLSRYAGFRYLSTELEALSLRGLHPLRWQVLSAWARRKSEIDIRRIFSMTASTSKIAVLIEASRSNYDSNASIIRGFTLLKEDLSSRALFSLPSLRISVDSFYEAYRSLAIIHADFLHVPGSFHSDPGEGVLISRVLIGPSGPVVEFVFTFPRLRGHRSKTTLDNSSFGDDFSAVAEVADKTGEFTKTLRDLVTQKSISVFSPKGKVFVLPKRSTALDFAFSVHTDIGLRAKSARINGVIRSITQELASGDIVDIQVDDDIVARAEWKALLHSPRSRTKLRQWLRESAKEDAVGLGRRLLQDSLRASSIPDELNSHNWDEIIRSFSVKDFTDLCFRIGGGEIPAYNVVTSLISRSHSQLLAITSQQDQRSRLSLDGSSRSGIVYCPICYPLPGDDIFALMSPSGIIVHRNSCNLLGTKRSARGYVYPIWAERIIEPLVSVFEVYAIDRKGLLADCARIISDASIDVVAVKTKSTRNANDNTAKLVFEVLIRSLNKLEQCSNRLQTVAGVLEVKRLGAENSV